jgi:hypothetical protein
LNCSTLPSLSKVAMPGKAQIRGPLAQL